MMRTRLFVTTKNGSISHGRVGISEQTRPPGLLATSLNYWASCPLVPPAASRYSAGVAAETLRRTPLFDQHVRLNARIVPFAGWEMPIQYKGISLEHEAVRTRAGLFDVCHMGEIDIRG